MKVTSQNGVSVYTVAGSNTTRTLPDWVIKGRKRSLKNDVEWQNRVELIQDFGFEEASQCIRVSEDGEYALATGTYKPQQHVYHLPSLSLKYSRHTTSLNVTFELLSADYSKSVHLQDDRSIEFHTPMGCHHRIRIPRYGRALAYQPARTELVIPAEGKEIYRFDLEAGRFLKPMEAHEGVGCVESVAHADKSHGLLAFGTDVGTVEFFDPRSRSRVGILGMPPSSYIEDPVTQERRAGRVTCLKFNQAGLTLACGTEAGIISLYDIRSPNPLLVKDQGYGFPIKNLEFLTTRASGFAADPRILSADKRIIKIWDQNTGAAYTSTEPPVDINDVAVIPDTGMIFTANEGPEMHTFFIPSLGPAPKWCSFLDSITEEMAESHLNDPDSYAAKINTDTGSAYDNYKFVTKSELEKLNLDHLIGKTKKDGTVSVLRPYMHGFFIDQKLYEEARLIADPFEWERERRNLVRKKIEKERESRIRSTKAELKVRVNKKFAERLAAKEEKANAKGKKDTAADVLKDERFKDIFENPEFEIDENTMEFKQLNPSTFVEGEKKYGRTAAESEEDRSENGSSSDSDSDSDASSSSSRPSPPPTNSRRKSKPDPSSLRLSTSNFSKSGKFPNKSSSSSNNNNKRLNTDRTFSSRIKHQSSSGPRERKSVVKELGGEKEIVFYPSSSSNKKKGGGEFMERDMGRKRPRGKEDRRSASGNVMRSMGR